MDGIESHRIAYEGGGGKLPINVKWCFEGEEEVGGESIAEYSASRRRNSKRISRWSATRNCSRRISRRYALDCADWSTPKSKPGAEDGSALRHVRRRGAQSAVRLVEIISKLKDSKGKVLIPGFYDKVRSLPRMN